MTEVAAVLQAVDGLPGPMGGQPLRQAQLENLAQSSELPRAIVQYGRIRQRVRHLEAICKGQKDGRVFPLFSQVKSAHGHISSADPRLFGPNVGLDAVAVLDEDIRQRIPHGSRALGTLQALTGDPVLKKDLRLRESESTAEGGPLAGVDRADAVISVAVGVSNAALCKLYLMDSRRAVALREHVTERYPRLFGWLDEYRRNTQSAGFAASGSRRKYLEGLRSSDVGKRQRALRSAVRWLIGM
jgi:hypothetical protein